MIKEKLKKAYESLEKRYPILKKIKEYIKRFWYNKYFHIGILIITVPFLFILVLKFIYAFLPEEKIGEAGEWISFAGSYLGVIGAVGAVWWQMKVEKQKSINEKEQKENDKILNLLNELIFFTSKKNINEDMELTQKIFSTFFKLYDIEKKYDIIGGNWKNILEEDRKILFSKKLDSFYFQTISTVKNINFNYFIFIKNRNCVHDIYHIILNSKVLNDSEKKVINHISFNLVKKCGHDENLINKYLEKINIKEWKNTIHYYKFESQNYFIKINLFLELLEQLYDYVVEEDPILKDKILEKKETFQFSINFLKLFNKRIQDIEKNLNIMHEKAVAKKKELEEILK